MVLTKVILHHDILTFYSSLSCFIQCCCFYVWSVGGSSEPDDYCECAWKQEEVVEHQIQIQALKNTSAASSASLTLPQHPLIEAKCLVLRSW